MEFFRKLLRLKTPVERLEALMGIEPRHYFLYMRPEPGSWAELKAICDSKIEWIPGEFAKQTFRKGEITCPKCLADYENRRNINA